MTNKPMLSVPRELIEQAMLACFEAGFGITHDKLRALLDKPVVVVDHSELMKLAEAATPGPWTYWGESAQEIFVSPRAEINPGTHILQARWDYKSENFEFIAAANPTVVLALLAEVAALRKDAEQPAPVADHPQCEECKGWGYHENHHEGGGTECGECGGSGNATAAEVMVMPERQIVPDNLMAGLTRKWCEGWNDALEEVARLNGVKP